MEKKECMSKIYTKTGDDGTTGLLGGTAEFRVSKSNPQIAIVGTVDEASSWIGFIRSSLSDRMITVDNDLISMKNLLDSIMSDLFEIGSELGAIHPDVVDKYLTRTISETRVEYLEKVIDAISSNLPTLKHFILPTGSRSASKFFIARTIVRKLERIIVEYMFEVDEYLVNPLIIKYLNRLGDLLFVFARQENEFSGGSIEWIPNK